MLWIDALCINQSDLQERSQQVRFMKLIYEKAKTVYTWLGGQDFGDATHGLQVIRNDSSLEIMQRSALYNDLTAPWVGWEQSTYQGSFVFSHYITSSGLIFIRLLLFRP